MAPLGAGGGGAGSTLTEPLSCSPPSSELAAVGGGLGGRHSPCPLLCPRLARHPAANASGSGGGSSDRRGGAVPWWKSWTKKYVILCCVCGGTAVMLGVVFIAIYFTLHYYTSSLQYFETIPTYAPAVVLIITGLLVMCFARRRNRYAYLIKLAGGCCLVCAVLCVVITVTTTVIHMNRLQTLRECVYTQKTKTCTCFAGIGDDDGTPRYVFSNTPDCEVVHGSLYTCLRAMFGLSVIGILVCIFSSMLVYQLLSHEKKKMYWEQLEMRRRFFYRQPSHPMYCNCYDDYGFAAPNGVYHWQPWEVNSDRCWPTRGMTPRIGFAGEEGSGSQRSILVGSTGHRASGWNWLPWSRNRNRQQQQQQQRSIGDAEGATSGAGVNSSAQGDVPRPPGVAGVGCESGEAGDSESPRLPLFAVTHPYWSVETRFGPRRNGRRHRSNDAVFHHLSMTPPTRYHHHQPPYVSTDGPTPLSFSAYGSLSRHMWGPPPPYSRPPSTENVVLASATLGPGATTTTTNNTTPMRASGAVTLPAYQERHTPHIMHHHHHMHQSPGATLEMAERGRVAIISDVTLGSVNGGVMSGGSDLTSTNNTVAVTAVSPNVKNGSQFHSTDSSVTPDDVDRYSIVGIGVGSGEYDATSGSKRMCMRTPVVASSRNNHHHHHHSRRRPLLQPCVHAKLDGCSTVPAPRVARRFFENRRARTAANTANNHHQPAVLGSKSAPHVWTTASDTLGSGCRLCHQHSWLSSGTQVKCCVHVQVSLDEMLVGGGESGDALRLTADKRHGLQPDGSDGTPDSCPSPLSTDNCNTTSSASFDADEEDEEEEEEPKSNLESGSMLVSSGPVSSSLGSDCFVPDMICARSLPNLNLSLGGGGGGCGPVDPVVGEQTWLPSRDIAPDNSQSPTPLDNDSGSTEKVRQDEDERQPLMDVVKQQSPSAIRGNGGGGGPLHPTGLSDSSPALMPLSVSAAYLSSGKSRGLTLDTIFANYCETTGATKSKSMGNLSPPQDSIIVTFKSIHV